jgi:2-oxoisovalerate dehydrogenase E1 component beta subunit
MSAGLADAPATPLAHPAALSTLTLAKALNTALHDCLEDDPKTLVMGEDVAALGGVFRITDGLLAQFGEERVIDTPLGESGIVGTAIGLAMRGYRPICEIQFDGFVYPAFDQIVSQLAKLHSRTGGAIRMPVTIRIPYGGGIGAVEHHSESPEAYFAHTAGLRVVSCSNPTDAYALLTQAVACDDPVIFFEPKRRYWEKGLLADPDLPLSAARVTRPGSALTLLAYGPMVRTCLDAAAASEHDLEVVDLRSLSPIDWPTVYASVARTRRAVVVHEAAGSFGIGAELAARLQQELFFELEAPVLRVTGFDVPYPPARIEEAHLPDLDRVLDAVDRAMAF